MLKSYETSRGIVVLSNTFTDKVMDDYIYFLKDNNYMKTTISGYMGKTAFMFRKMAKRGFDVDFSFEDVVLGEEEDSAAVYVSIKELEHISSIKIKNKERDVVRDMFVCNCLIGMRYGDFSSLTASNVSGKIISLKTRKTGEVVQVPAHRIVREIMQKYGGDFPRYEKSLQNYNVIVKNVCKQAGLTDKVLWERTVGHKVVRKTCKRYELIGSHSARRSFATNAYISGIAPARIMLITGHKTEQSFFKYIRISKKENAKELLEHPFFSE